jgi:hypothetical protein
MPGDVLLIGIAQLAIVIAGFSAISATLLPAGSTWSASQRIRLRIIVSTSLNVTFESLIPVIAFPALGDARSAFVLASALTAIYLIGVVLVRTRQIARARAFHARSTQLIMSAAIGSILLFGLNAIVVASMTLFALALCTQLLVAAFSFYSLISTSPAPEE